MPPWSTGEVPGRLPREALQGDSSWGSRATSESPSCRAPCRNSGQSSVVTTGSGEGGGGGGGAVLVPVPFPISVIVGELPGALLCKVKLNLRPPNALGVNFTRMRQCSPGARGGPLLRLVQSLPILKS